MCGITGFVGSGSQEDLEQMASSLEHRGPDEEGFWSDSGKGIYLAHKRLSIIDISGGAQPMLTPDERTAVIFNGEIYNHLELRAELESLGYTFFTDHSDTEVLLWGYREWGTDMPEKLNGMWSFAIYDKENNVLFLSRDRFGKKPLFYTFQNNTFVFASELTALIKHSFVESSISPRSLKKYFAYGFIPAPSSLFSNIYKLPAGHNLIFKNDSRSLIIKKYWDFIIEPFESIPDNPEDVWGEQLRDLLKKAVGRRLMSDVPLGIFLSGGIDSSSITAFAVEISGSQGIKTFTTGFREKSFDESGYAKAVADLFHTKHHAKILSIEQSREQLSEIISKLDEPLGDSSILPTFQLCRETKKHVTVALGGDGSDELFGGYDPFQALRLANLYSKIVPKPIHRGIRMAVSLLPVSHQNISPDFKIKRTLRGLSYPKHLWNPVWLGPLEPREIDELFREPTDIEDIYSEAIDCWDNCNQNDPVDKTLQFYTKLYLQDNILVKSDRAGMMNSLEIRAPFLDADLVDFVRRIPNSWKFRNGSTKYILKKAMEPMLPHSILYRKKKGFGAPFGRWFRSDLLSVNPKKSSPWVDEALLGKKILEHRHNRSDHRLMLWNLWVLENYITKLK